MDDVPRAGVGIVGILNETVPQPGWETVAVTGVFAAMVSMATFVSMLTDTRKLLRLANVLGTIFHEGGHAFVSVLTGGGVRRIEVTNADSGATWHWTPSRLSRIFTGAAGYAMPPLAGLAAAALLHRGQAPAVLALTVAAMALVLLVTRDLLTLVLVVGVAGVAFAALRWGAGPLQNSLAYAESWLLLTSEIGGLAAIIANRVSHGYHGQSDDAAALAECTPIPAFAWIAGWFALIGWALWRATPLLWPA